MANAGDPWRKAPGRHVEGPEIARAAESVAAREVDDSESRSGTLRWPWTDDGVMMKRGNQFVTDARGRPAPGRQACQRLDGDVSDDRDAGRDGDSALRQTVRESGPWARSTRRAIRDLYAQRRPILGVCGARSDAASYVRSSRWRTRTIYELERRGEFPQRFYLTARCVVGPGRGDGLAAEPAQAGNNGVKRRRCRMLATI